MTYTVSSGTLNLTLLLYYRPHMRAVLKFLGQGFKKLEPNRTDRQTDASELNTTLHSRW